jgi:hypothetical protein
MDFHTTCALATALLVATQTSASTDGTIEVIDFEEYAENIEIGLQYKAQFGVEFSLVGGGLPIVANEGGTAVAFSSPAGADLYMSSGARGLTAFNSDHFRSTGDLCQLVSG